MHTPKTHMFFDCKHQLFQVVLHLFSKFFKRCQLQSVVLQIGQINFFIYLKNLLLPKSCKLSQLSAKNLPSFHQNIPKNIIFCKILQIFPTLKLNITSHFANPNTSRKQLFFRTWSGFVFFWSNTRAPTKLIGLVCLSKTFHCILPQFIDPHSNLVELILSTLAWTRFYCRKFSSLIGKLGLKSIVFGPTNLTQIDLLLDACFISFKFFKKMRLDSLYFYFLFVQRMWLASNLWTANANELVPFLVSFPRKHNFILRICARNWIRRTIRLPVDGNLSCSNCPTI